MVLRALLRLFRLLDVVLRFYNWINGSCFFSLPTTFPPHRPYDLMEEKETGSRHEVHEDDVNDYEIEHGE